MRLRRYALASLVAAAPGAILALAPATASAAGETVLTYSGNPMAGSSITVSASPGQANNIAVRIVDFNLDGFPDFAIRDTSGVTESPDTEFCAPMPPFEVRCMAQGLQSLSLQTGDINDVLRMYESIVIGSGFGGAVVDTGTGDDAVFAQLTGNDDCYEGTFNSCLIMLEGGDDRARVSGSARVSGGQGRDKLRGRGGNQRLFGNQQNDRIACGKGNRDLGNGGPAADRVASSCERIVNP